MAKIRVIKGGCGIIYQDAHGTLRHACKTAENGPFECEDAQADRLVRLGVAVYVTGAAESPAAAETTAAAEAEAEKAGTQAEAETAGKHLDAAELETWDYNELKKLAADMGAEPKSQKKADLIAAIVAIEVEAGNEESDDLPDLDAADPV